ncbi:hypothetical protein PybrP1_000575 [[Pythium] brassicae (nom. inval.)]|nr:hypothetical protein PybrP1_000575 [[Pythium] brassicae (nom. inval.)]
MGFDASAPIFVRVIIEAELSDEAESDAGRGHCQLESETITSGTLMEIEVLLDPAAGLAADAALAAQIDELGASSAVVRTVGRGRAAMSGCFLTASHVGSQAQKLRRAITSTALFASQPQPQPQTLFVAREGPSGAVAGFLKSGVKHLFYVVRAANASVRSSKPPSRPLRRVFPARLCAQNRRGEYTELDLLCVLDFFVRETHQRSGVGLELFERLLEVRYGKAAAHLDAQQRRLPVTLTKVRCCFKQTHGVGPEQLAYDRPSPKLFAFLNKHCGLTEFVPQPNNFVVFESFFDDVKCEQPER